MKNKRLSIQKLKVTSFTTKLKPQQVATIKGQSFHIGCGAESGVDNKVCSPKCPANIML